MQKSTRYVNVSLGVGGWQPIAAKDVYKHGYGDCKALSNYMKALLKEAGITAHYTLVNAGARARRLLADLPGSSFNHAILCVFKHLHIVFAKNGFLWAIFPTPN